MEIRPATAADLPRCAGLMFEEPSAEMVGLYPSIDAARRMTIGAWREPAGFLVAVDGDDLLGFAQVGGDGSLGSYAGAALRAFGPIGVVRLVVRGWPRQQVSLSSPEGAVVLQELHVDPRRRGGGIGAALLERVISDAGERPIALTTRIDNPARHLYERHGFAVVAERRHPAYERRTGSPGRVLMVRPVPFTPHG